MSKSKVYVSITGLRLRASWHAPRFWWHAVRSMKQARLAPGNISAETRTINGVHHTVSVWRDRKSMLDYLRSGAHREAMRIFPGIATGKTFGFLADQAPDWNGVHVIWQNRGRDV